MRRLRGTTVLVVAGSLLATLAIGPAEAKKRSCKNKKEQSGCKLKKDAAYQGSAKDGRGVGLSVDRGFWRAYVRVAGCNKRGNVGQTFTGRPKVGATYNLTINRREGAGTVRIYTTFSGKVKINSAKKATFSGNYERRIEARSGSPAPCQASIALTAKRTQ